MSDKTIERYKLEQHLENAFYALLEMRGMTPVLITDVEEAMEEWSLLCTAAIGAARRDHVQITRLVGDGSYGELDYFDAQLVIRLVIPVSEDWASEVAMVRESIREYYLPELNDLSGVLYIHDILPTGTERIEDQGRIGFTFSYSVIAQIKPEAYGVPTDGRITWRMIADKRWVELNVGL
jgi:hypothetical protein